MLLLVLSPRMARFVTLQLVDAVPHIFHRLLFLPYMSFLALLWLCTRFVLVSCPDRHHSLTTIFFGYLILLMQLRGCRVRLSVLLDKGLD